MKKVLTSAACYVLLSQSVSADALFGHTYLDGYYLSSSSDFIDTAYKMDASIALNDSFFLKAGYRALELADLAGFDANGNLVAVLYDNQVEQIRVGVGVNGMIAPNTEASLVVSGVRENVSIRASSIYGEESGSASDTTYAVELGVRHRFAERVEGYIGLSKVYDSVIADGVEYDVGGRYDLNDNLSVGLGYTGEFSDSDSEGGAAYSSIRLGTL